MVGRKGRDRASVGEGVQLLGIPSGPGVYEIPNMERRERFERVRVTIVAATLPPRAAATMTLSTAEQNALSAFFKTKRGNRTLRAAVVAKLVGPHLAVEAFPLEP